MAKQKIDPTRTPKIGIKAKNLSTKVETLDNSARLRKKSTPYKNSKISTERTVKRITFKSGATLSKQEVTVPGAFKTFRYKSTEPLRKK